MGKNSFVLGSSWAKRMLDVPDEDFAVIVKAVFQFAVSGDHEEVKGLHKALVDEMTDFLAENAERYEEVCEKRRLAGSIGGKQKVANAKQNVANATKCLANGSKGKQNVADNDNDNDNVNVNENVFPSERRKKMCSKEHIKEIVDAWNSIFANTDVPKVTVVKSGSLREKAINARLKDNSKEDIINAMHSAAHSSFLTSSSWFSFDWFMKPNNFVKVIEGNYADHAQKPAPQNKQTDKLQDFYDMAVKWAEGG